jgi:pimeloyl-ACP methyl ester carboxylesterase
MNPQLDAFDACLDQAIDRLGGPASEPPPRIPPSQRRRRDVRAEDYSSLGAVTLIDDDGLLRWVYEAPPARVGRRRARRRAVPSIDGVPIRTIPIHDLPTNQVLASIGALDRTLTPNQGLRVWRDGTLQPLPAQPLKAKRVLLLIHGTFSKSDMFFEELGATVEGKAYLAAAAAGYGAILAFDHPTLAVSPWINALDLEAALSGITGTVDVVCHSRGGLVAAWWLRLARRDVGHVVFVGSPLAGTSLASPAALRQALDHLATAARGIALGAGAATTVLPFMSVVTGLATTLGKVLQLGADLPLADLAVVSVPGLASQSRVSNNAEMLRLFSTPWPSGPQLHAVIGNFKPLESDAGWRFWRRLTNIGDQIKFGAAQLIFDAPNDLVVDTGCMIGPGADGALPPGSPPLHELVFDAQRITQFENSALVHHINYFRQPQTVAALRAIV